MNKVMSSEPKNRRVSIDIQRLKIVAIGIFSILTFLAPSPVHASVCRNDRDQLVCILSIQRSAKNYWEYRASVSVNGQVRPVEVYNCRQEVRISKNGLVVPFQVDRPGELICSFFKK
jgi:hypothetical protein